MHPETLDRRPTSPINCFYDRLGKTYEILRGQLGRVTDGDQIGKVLDAIRQTEKTLGWMPPPRTAGNGTTGEASRRMSGGGMP